jgi:hypothetical protein
LVFQFSDGWPEAASQFSYKLVDYCSWFKYLTDFLNFSNCNETHHIYAYYSSSPEMKT